MRRLARALLALPLLTGSFVRAEEVKTAQPYELVRSLQRLQDQIAAGGKSALGEQGRLVEHVAVGFLTATPEVWKEKRNQRALVTYLFSGGHPQTVRALIDRHIVTLEQDASRPKPEPPKEAHAAETHGTDAHAKTAEGKAEPDKGAAEAQGASDSEKPGNLTILIQGALAYAEGRDGDAKTLLDGLDPRAFTASLGGHLALIQAMLAGPDDTMKAMRALDLARLLVPGTLVEEAALRRELFIVGETKNLTRFLSLSREYIERFNTSVYAQNFRQRFIASLTHFTLTGSPSDIQAIFRLVGELDVDVRRRVFLTLAQAAVARGRTDVAAMAARNAREAAPTDSSDRQRADLYLSATQILSDTYDKGLATAEAIDSKRLSKRDAALKEAVVAVAKTIRRPPVLAPKPDPRPATAQKAGVEAARAEPPKPAKMASGTDAPPVAGPDSSDTINLAEKALADADQSLKGATP